MLGLFEKAILLSAYTNDLVSHIFWSFLTYLRKPPSHDDGNQIEPCGEHFPNKTAQSG